MKFLGTLLNLISILGIILAVVFQMYLNYTEFGVWYSGYIIVHWSLAGLIGLFILPLGYRLIENSGKNKDKKE